MGLLWNVQSCSSATLTSAAFSSATQVGNLYLQGSIGACAIVLPSPAPTCASNNCGCVAFQANNGSVTINPNGLDIDGTPATGSIPQNGPGVTICTTGTNYTVAAGMMSTMAIPNGVTGTTQATGDTTAKLATGKAIVGDIGANAGGFGTDTGSVNAYAVSPAGCNATLSIGFAVAFVAANANTSSTPTLAYCGGTGVTITRNGQSALAADPSDIITTKVQDYTYDGTYWELKNPATSPFSLTFSTNVTNLTTALYFGAGISTVELAIGIPTYYSYVINKAVCLLGGAGSSGAYWIVTLRQNGAACNSSSIQLQTNSSVSIFTATGICVNATANDYLDFVVSESGSPSAHQMTCVASGYRSAP